LSRWIRDTLNGAAAASVEAQEERRAEAERQRRERGRPARMREIEAYLAAQVAEAERPGPAVEPPAGPPVEEPAEEELYRTGRCRTHPNALPRFNDYSRCGWGCRLP